MVKPKAQFNVPCQVVLVLRKMILLASYIMAQWCKLHNIKLDRFDINFTSQVPDNKGQIFTHIENISIMLSTAHEPCSL